MAQVTKKYIGLTILILLIVGCKTVPHHNKQGHKSTGSSATLKKQHDAPDSAPSGPVPTFFKVVKPIYEPLSRYGNPSTYRVNGQKYTVMTTASGYRTRGLASWYGTKFHRRRTSSGEDYDMYALTAAHKTLPLPTYIKVKNLDNGRSAIVKVNDRGPFHAGRILDLSYGASVKLGIFPKGTAHVEIEALTVRTAGHAKVAHYYLQAGAFSSKQFAEQLKVKLASMSPSPVFIERNKQQYLVRLGPFGDKKMVEGLKQRLARKGITDTFTLLL